MAKCYEAWGCGINLTLSTLKLRFTEAVSIRLNELMGTIAEGKALYSFLIHPVMIN